MKKYYVLLAGLLVALTFQIEAKEVIKTYDQAPSAAELARVLGLKVASSSQSPVSQSPVKKRSATRRIYLYSPSSAAPAEQPAEQPSPSASAGDSGDAVVLAFPLYFKSGSSKLTSQATPFVDSLGALMKMDPTLRFQVEGHTDSEGSATDNLRLSRERAISVIDHLVNKHSIDASRLVPVGKGSQEPLKGVSPRDDTNRRVQFRKIG
jgi:outer membrane protein OmpA-like peptidoglycan-associated protein